MLATSAWVVGSGQGAHPLSGEGLGQADAVAGGLTDVGVVQEPVDGCGRDPPCQAVVRHPGAPGSTVEGGDRRQFREQQQSGSSRCR